MINHVLRRCVYSEYTQVFASIIKCDSKSSTVEAKSKVTSEITTLLLR